MYFSKKKLYQGKLLRTNAQRQLHAFFYLTIQNLRELPTFKGREKNYIVFFLLILKCMQVFLEKQGNFHCKQIHTLDSWAVIADKNSCHQI